MWSYVNVVITTIIKHPWFTCSVSLSWNLGLWGSLKLFTQHGCEHLKGTVHPKMKNPYFFLLPAVLFVHLDCFGDGRSSGDVWRRDGCLLLRWHPACAAAWAYHRTERSMPSARGRKGSRWWQQLLRWAVTFVSLVSTLLQMWATSTKTIYMDK